MNFAYYSYRHLLERIENDGYAISDYHMCDSYSKCVILRHDIDTSLEAALNLARIECGCGVKSTWFILLKTDFYNIASAHSQKIIQEIISMGHEIGLHFDEKSYSFNTHSEDVPKAIIKEAAILSDICDYPITTVSMHRPSKETLDADYSIPGIVNSYGNKFFKQYKYLSDSRCRWREPVEEIVSSGKYDKLHILTHAFWYHETDQTINETIASFVNSANRVKYDQLTDNITDLAAIMKPEEVR